MSKARLAFCDSEILRAWAEDAIAVKAHRQLQPGRRSRILPVINVLRVLVSQGVQLATTVSAAALVFTDLYKGDLPFTGDVRGFPLRKGLARQGAKSIRDHIHLVSPSAGHFWMAQELWLSLCERGHKPAYAQFADYVDAAFIMKPIGDLQITHVLSRHAHLKYILEKSEFTECVCFVL